MTSAEKINICSIQRFCVHDGPGIRTTVFVEGCPLRCWWCHNPAMQAVNANGSPRDVNELLGDVARDARYWMHSGGGLTLSGGEPLVQPGACAAFLSAIGDRGWHRCVETSGHAPADALSLMDDDTDLWLFDLKTVNANAFKQATSGDLDIVLENLRCLLRRRADTVWLRIPLIKGFTMEEDNLIDIGRFVGDLPAPARLQLLPGHRIGVLEQRDPTVDAEDCRRAKDIMRRFNTCVEILW